MARGLGVLVSVSLLLTAGCLTLAGGAPPEDPSVEPPTDDAPADPPLRLPPADPADGLEAFVGSVDPPVGADELPPPTGTSGASTPPPPAGGGSGPANDTGGDLPDPDDRDPDDGSGPDRNASGDDDPDDPAPGDDPDEPAPCETDCEPCTSGCDPPPCEDDCGTPCGSDCDPPCEEDECEDDPLRNVTGKVPPTPGPNDIVGPFTAPMGAASSPGAAQAVALLASAEDEPFAFPQPEEPPFRG